MSNSVLLVKEMYQADNLAVQIGGASLDLMEQAGQAVADAICARLPTKVEQPRKALILAGPGNNGGDGFVVARHLAAAGWAVDVALLGDRQALSGDAQVMADQWDGSVAPLSSSLIKDQDCIVDALFGAGLSRALDGVAAQVVRLAKDSGAYRVAIDVPSGIDGDSGQPLGDCFAADLTVTFFRKKPAHLLMPGRMLCGEVVVADIGIPDTVLAQIKPNLWENSPDLWSARWPWPRMDGHKYSRGHSLILSGPMASVGAASLAAMASLRIGSGLASIACPADATAVLAAKHLAVMVKPYDDADDFSAIVADRRKNAVLAGPGNGVTAALRDRVLHVLSTAQGFPTTRALVLDADALTVFSDDPDTLFAAIAAAGQAVSVVLTPHDGEFARLFPDLVGHNMNKIARCRAAVRRSQAVVLLKGADTVIAAPDGRCIISVNAPPDLATAGAGDVLAGLITGLLAQGMTAFEAAAAAAWVHGEAARGFGSGLIADDLPQLIPGILRLLRAGFYGDADNANCTL